MARVKRTAPTQHRTSEMASRFRDTRAHHLVRLADTLDAGSTVTVMGYSLYRHLGPDYLPHVGHWRCTVHPNGHVDRCIDRRLGSVG